MKKPLVKIKFFSAFFLFILLLFSCVKDVDLGQYEEIVLPPQASLDLIFFNLTSEDFTGEQNNRLRAADVTRLDFLDDDYIQNNLKSANLNFRFTNSFQREFVAVIKLLSEGNGVQHEILIPIPAGTTDSPAKVNYTDIINEDQINKIRRSIKMSVEITTHSGPFVDGELQLQSRGFFYFEF
ncbi:hypothetical protein [Salinimicrobium xinjiangense]|uniref:hypothetical protein n=1 Tax=Salinimicrobium xinjiangense TaxID=438596 RepID=UPI0004042073|nr:hypothetical protein [Salinimicrobium xinjiangense]